MGDAADPRCADEGLPHPQLAPLSIPCLDAAFDLEPKELCDPMLIA